MHADDASVEDENEIVGMGFAVGAKVKPHPVYSCTFPKDHTKKHYLTLPYGGGFYFTTSTNTLQRIASDALKYLRVA